MTHPVLEALADLPDEIRNIPFDAHDHLYRVAIRTGLNIAAEYVEKRRIDILVETLADSLRVNDDDLPTPK